jgi:hypothetical protein
LLGCWIVDVESFCVVASQCILLPLNGHISPHPIDSQIDGHNSVDADAHDRATGPPCVRFLETRSHILGGLSLGAGGVLRQVRTEMVSFIRLLVLEFLLLDNHGLET